MKRSSTKGALYTSFIALVLCCTMLLGTTFAWFTDEVTSTNNIIKSGSLDIELEYSKDMTSWTPVDATTNVFKENALWEPGYSEVVYFRVTNMGDLALKYQLAVNVAVEKEGTNKAGDGFKLSDYIEYGVIETETAYADRATAVSAVTEPVALNEEYKQVYTMETKGTVDTYALVAYMPEEVGNVANHKPGDANKPKITLGIGVYATQLTYENDSFDDQYDKDAIDYDVLVTNAEELYTAVAAATGDTVIAIDGNIALTENLAKSGLKSITLVAFDDGATIDQATYKMAFNGAEVTFQGLTLTHGEKAYGDGGQTSTAFAVWHAKEVNYIDCTFNRSVGTIHAPMHNFIRCTFNGVDNPGNLISEYPLYICDGQDYNVIDCTFNCTNRGAILFYNDGGTGTDTLNISGTKFLGDIIDDKTAVEIHNNSASQVYNVNIKDVEVGSGVINGLYRIKSANVGEVNVSVDGVTKSAEVSNNEELTAAVSGGAKIVYLASGEYELKGNQTDGLNIIGVGEGVKLSNLTNFAGNGNLGAIWRNVNFENVIFTEKVYTMADGAQSTFKNCVFENGFRGGYSKGVKFDGCTFYDNDQGFAMHFEKVYTTVDVNDCYFAEGTIAFGDNGDGLVTFNKCKFSGESTRTEYFDAWASCVLNDCEFEKATEIWHEQWENGETVTLNNTTGATVVQK